MVKINQIYHHYEKWEDYKNGMWRKANSADENDLLKVAVEFTGDDEKYGAAMMKVIKAWPITCEHNLSDTSLNRRAFVGHAAVCFELGIPEYITRMAWHCLTDEQRYKANLKADIAIIEWEKSYIKKEHAQTILEF